VSNLQRHRLSHYFGGHPLNLRHVVVKNGLLAAIIPFDGYASPILFSDGALIIIISIPPNAVADLNLSGLVTGHKARPTIPRYFFLPPHSSRRIREVEDETPLSSRSRKGTQGLRLRLLPTRPSMAVQHEQMSSALPPRTDVGLAWPQNIKRIESYGIR
jgi:hypothetical protein